MGIGDFVILGFLVLWILGAAAFMWRRKRRGGCIGCSGCTSSDDCLQTCERKKQAFQGDSCRK